MTNQSKFSNFFYKISHSPAQVIMLSFISIILTGAILLSLPIASNSGEWTAFIDAVFTATSAVCVTGQITLNTMEHWNYFGRTVIIILIEIGGIGFMTLMITGFMILKKRINLTQHKVTQEAMNIDNMSEVGSIVKYVFKFSAIVQLLGASLLAIDFIPRLGLAKGIYYAVFHSISAFCNAGFDLFGDSMIGFQDNPLVLMTMSSLIVIGGVGFIVWRDLLQYFKTHKLLLQTKLVVPVTIGLLLVSTLLFFLTEHGVGHFDHLPWRQQLINYWFLAVTPRTAGFANIDYANISLAGSFLTNILMFIGGSSGSTAGGVKITTISVLVIFAWNLLRGKDVVFLKRQIMIESVRRAVFVFLAGIVLVTIASIWLLLTQPIPDQFGIEYILMEVFSCFGTVGLTMGLTPFLTMDGKIILILLMFIGRIGILTTFWSINTSKQTKVQYPVGRILIG